jgi:hypothetical protein
MIGGEKRVRWSEYLIQSIAKEKYLPSQQCRLFLRELIDV